MATNPQNPRQTDLEDNDVKVDRAISAVRDFQKGKSTVGFLRQALAAVPVQQLSWVSVATRVPVAEIKALRGDA